MPKAALTRKKVLTDFRRAEILAAAMVVFGKKGFDATRMDEVAKQAKIAKGTLYLYFRSKRDIYTTAVELATARLQNLTNERVGEAANLRDRLVAFITVRVKFWGEHKALHGMILTIGREAVNHKLTLVLQKTSIGSLIQIFEQAAREGEISRQPFDSVAWAALDMIRGSNERRFSGVTRTAPEVETHQIADFVLKTLR
jgi:AcrR family transcriptional regulator